MAASCAAPRAFDVLINVAGVLYSGQTGELKPDEVSAMLDVNVKGTIYGTNAAAQVMKPRGFGHIINIGSTASLSHPWHAHLCHQ